MFDTPNSCLASGITTAIPFLCNPKRRKATCPEFQFRLIAVIILLSTGTGTDAALVLRTCGVFVFAKNSNVL